MPAVIAPSPITAMTLSDLLESLLAKAIPKADEIDVELCAAPNGSNSLHVYFGKEPIDGGSSNLNEETLIYDQFRIGDGLFDGEVKLADLNNDGKLDILAGNHGLNSRFRASKIKPLKLYFNDFDKHRCFDFMAANNFFNSWDRF